MICPSCKEELPAVCPECKLPRHPQWLACSKIVPGLEEAVPHLCVVCAMCMLKVSEENSRLAQGIVNSMTDTNEATRMPDLDIRTGVDADWIADSRVALTVLLKDPEKFVRELGGTSRSGESHADTVVRLSCEIADSMRAQRISRGGVRNGSDPREMMAMFQENMPMILQFFEKLGALSEKRRG